ncbi:MAG: hypothetical protein R3E01_07805 [Pirellulaceae bacterium]|nr:hypothetical protein [Planctomycetales bacterium]
MNRPPSADGLVISPSPLATWVRLMVVTGALAGSSWFVSPAPAQQVRTVNDVTFVVGDGPNVALLALDWYGDAGDDESYVWAYCWTGIASSEDMLRAVAAADPKLFLKFGTDELGNTLFGIGYNRDADDSFGISDFTQFDSDGIAVGAVGFVPAGPTDGDDLYREGWAVNAYWQQGVSHDEPFNGGRWEVGSGLARQLTTGDWESWAFSPNFLQEFYAQNPVAATLANETVVPEGNVFWLIVGWSIGYRQIRRMMT